MPLSPSPLVIMCSLMHIVLNARVSVISLDPLGVDVFTHSYCKKNYWCLFAHRWLSSRSKNYSEPMIRSHYKKRDSSKTDHDHFLTCDASKIQKERRLADFKLLLTSMKTPNEIISILHKDTSSFYNESIPIPSKIIATFI